MYNVVLQRLAGLAAVLNMALMMCAYGVFLGCSYYGMDRWAPLFFGLVMLNYPLLIISYNLKRERLARIGRTLALLIFAGTVVGTGWAWWFHENGVWQPWADLGKEQVVGVELAYYEDGQRVGRELSATEAERARALAAGAWVRNPCVYDGYTVIIPDGMPAVSGAGTDLVIFRMASGRERYFSIKYPYYGGYHLAADLVEAREVEGFINGLSEKYFVGRAEQGTSSSEDLLSQVVYPPFR